MAQPKRNRETENRVYKAPESPLPASSEMLDYIADLIVELEAMAAQLQHVELQHYLRRALKAAKSPID